MQQARVIQLPVRRVPQLSPREQHVLELTACGLEPPEIAKRLSEAEGTFVAQETVESHAHCARAKLGARSTAHAVAIALDRRLIRLDASS